MYNISECSRLLTCYWSLNQFADWRLVSVYLISWKYWKQKLCICMWFILCLVHLMILSGAQAICMLPIVSLSSEQWSSSVIIRGFISPFARRYLGKLQKTSQDWPSQGWVLNLVSSRYKAGVVPMGLQCLVMYALLGYSVQHYMIVLIC